MNRAKNISGQKFGKLTVLRRAGKWDDGSALWRCRCECGAQRVVPGYELRSGKVKSCKKCRDPQTGSWTAAEENLLRDLYPTSKLEAIVDKFPGRTEGALRSRAGVLGLEKAIGYGGKVHWTRKMEAIVRRRYPHMKTFDLALELGVSTLALHQRADKLGVKKTAQHMARVLKECGQQISSNAKAIASRFQKGIVPANKGLRRPGYSIGRGRMRETQFKKGQSPQNAMPLWTFRWVNQGSGNGRGAGTPYMMLKTGKPGPNPYSGWEWVHKLVWEHAHGPIPPGHRIWWKDRDHANNSLGNLELVSDHDHMLRTTVHNLPKPLVQVIQLAGALKRKIRRKEKQLNGEEHIAGSQGSSVRDAGIAL